MRCNACHAEYMRLHRAGRKVEASAINPHFTLKRHPDLYKRWPKCPRCKSVNTASFEKHRQREMQKYRDAGLLCSCLPFLHKKGEILGCAHGPEVTDQNWPDVEAMLATPRGGK